MLYLVSEIVLVDDASWRSTRSFNTQDNILLGITQIESNQTFRGCPTSILQIQNDFTKLKIKPGLMICNWYFSLHRTTDIHYDYFVCNTHRV